MSGIARLRASQIDGGLLAEPPIAEGPARLTDNVRRLDAWNHDFQGRSAGVLRALVRQEVLALARAHHERFELDPGGPAAPGAPVVATGHQPELFHPGVWVKNFALAGLAARTAATPINLIVDNDVEKASAIRVPSGTERGLRAPAVEFDAEAAEVPFEDLRVRDERIFHAFPERVRATLGGLVADPLLGPFWKGVERASRLTDRLGMRFAVARRAWEASWGAHNWEVPLSAVCESEGFLWFASHVLAHLPRFQAIHNESLARYRKAHAIRSRHHPVPALERQGEWLEAPFWVWRAQRPRRRPLLVRQRARAMELRIAGEDDILIEIPLSATSEACCAVDRLRELPSRGVRLRTRALTTTMFARLLMGDLFVHGIGGAKYDELGDVITRAFFGFEPPAYLTLSLTLWLGLPDDPASPDRLHALQHQLRDLEFHPERHLDPGADPRLADLLEGRRRALEWPTEFRSQRVARFYEIRARNRALAPFLEAERARRLEERDATLAGLRHNRVARSREYSFVLHSEARLREVFRPFAPS